MTATDPRERTTPEIGQPRAARQIKMGWHVQLAGAWELVLDAIPSQVTKDVLLVLRDGLHGERTLALATDYRPMTRTPQEQIQWVEARRLAARNGHGPGPITQLHLKQQQDGSAS